MDENRQNLDRLVGVLTLLLVFAMAARFAVGADTWWHLRAGEWIWQHGRLPWVDHFSYTRAGTAWHYPGWPVEVLMYGMVRAWGLGALGVWQAVMVTAVFAIVWKMSAGHPFLKAVLVLLGAVTASLHWTARPYLVTLLMTALFLWLLKRWKAGQRRALWWLPVLMVVWVNSHGGYILGLAWWGVYFVDALARCAAGQQMQGEGGSRGGRCRDFRDLALVGALLVVAMLINPYGAEMLTYPFYTLHMEATKSFIAEWQSPDFHRALFWPLLSLLLLLVGGAALSARRWALEEALLAMGLVYMVLNWMRNVDVFAVVVVPLLVRDWEGILTEGWQRVRQWLPQREAARAAQWHPRVNLAFVALVALGVFFKAGVVALPQVTEAAVAQQYPVDAVAFLQSAPVEGHLFNDYNWGGFLTWRLREYPVFIDGRADLYGDAFIKEWLKVMRAEPGWDAVLDYWDVRRVLIRPDAPLGDALLAHGWRLLYQDDLSEIYGR